MHSSNKKRNKEGYLMDKERLERIKERVNFAEGENKETVKRESRVFTHKRKLVLLENRVS